MSVRADLVACWPFRLDAGGSLEILLLRRAPDRNYPGLWQCVTGSLETGETMAAGALRELREETGLAAADIEVFSETDIVNWFHAADGDAVLCEVVFAVRVRRDAAVTLSVEHDDLRWCAPGQARELVVWPAYARAIEQLEWLVANPDRAAAYRLPTPA
jgi:8-oxo-dGTP pyrophosphatase MutT (NUDIX family)